MSPFTAYFLGILTVLLILIPFWAIAVNFSPIGDSYRSVMCYKICPDPKAPEGPTSPSSPDDGGDDGDGGDSA